MGIGDRLAGAEPSSQSGSRYLQLLSQRFVVARHQAWVIDGVRADLPPLLGKIGQLAPRQRRNRVLRELRPRLRITGFDEVEARKDRAGNAATLEDGQRRERGPT